MQTDSCCCAASWKNTVDMFWGDIWSEAIYLNEFLIYNPCLSCLLFKIRSHKYIFILGVIVLSETSLAIGKTKCSGTDELKHGRLKQDN